jgi:hypothetical protein
LTFALEALYLQFGKILKHWPYGTINLSISTGFGFHQDFQVDLYFFFHYGLNLDFIEILNLGPTGGFVFSLGL